MTHFRSSRCERNVEREGHARVPAGHVEAGFRLGQWVKVQRRSHPTMSADRAARLEALPGWTWEARRKRRPTGLA